MSYTLIERKELTEAASSISFDNIPQFYTDLYVLVSARSTGNSGVGGAYAEFRPNGLTSGLSSRTLRGLGSGSVQSNPETFLIVRINPSNYTGSTFCNSSVYIFNYSGATNKSFSIDAVLENNATEGQQELATGLWSNTAAITSFVLVPGSGNLVVGSSVSLYGINRQQAIGAPKAVGGAITFANGYWVHTFTGSGTFASQESLNIDALIVAGGGGGSQYTGAGGGGAGGFRSINKNLSSGNYSVIVGAGGAGGVNTTQTFNGSNSSLDVEVSIGGGGGGGYLGSFYAAKSGGSGGGGAYAATTAGGAGTSGQGNNGGSGGGSDSGGGGGGAGGAGGTGGASGGNGGPGQIWVGNYYSGGGGGGRYPSGSAGSGGIGGGGSGGVNGTGVSSGSTNTGGGGGGNGNPNLSLSGGAGGSGIVIIRYLA